MLLPISVKQFNEIENLVFFLQITVIFLFGIYLNFDS